MVSKKQRTDTANAAGIPDSEYVTVSPKGTLQRRGSRVRFWGIIGHWVNTWQWEHGGEPVASDTPEVRRKKIDKGYKDLAAAAQRIADLGFNLMRFWDRHQPGVPYTMGDGSPNDRIAFFLNELDKRGVTIWLATLMGGEATPEDVSLVADASTASAWVDAVKGEGGTLSVWSPARVWDRRLEEVSIRYARSIAEFPNHYKNGLRLVDDPQVVVWEILNEERWRQKMIRGEWQRLPQFFQDQLLAQWNAFLSRKYGTDEKLREIWLGVLPGESLADKTVQLMPMLNETGTVMPSDANPHVIALLKQTAGQKFGREHFNRQRGADVLEFFMDLLISHKERQKAALKTWGRSCALSPCITSTCEGYDIQDLWKYQHSDATAIATYMNGIHHDPTHERFPWMSGVEELPRTGWDVPWMETQRIPNKPYFVYEVGFENAGKYRAEWPYRIASLASIQDMDIINWHIFDNHVRDSSLKEPYSEEMWCTHSDPKINGSEGPVGLMYSCDEVMVSAMKAAGEMFKNMTLKPAPNPTTYIFGKKSLFDPATMDYGVAYGRVGHTVMPTTYRYGSRMYIDINRDDDQVIGPTYKARVFEPSPIKPTDQIEYHWRQGHLLFDAPASVGYVGFYGDRCGPVEFSNGIVLDKVSIENPKGIAYPVTDDELYVCFSLVSSDGKPLGKTKRALLSLVSTSFNKGFKLNHAKMKNEYLWQANPGLIVSRGTKPVLVARAGAVVTAPMLDGMSYTMLDWHLRTVAAGVVKKGRMVVPSNKPVFVIELRR